MSVIVNYKGSFYLITDNYMSLAAEEEAQILDKWYSEWHISYLVIRRD